MHRTPKIPLRRLLSKTPFHQTPKPSTPIPFINTPKTLSSNPTNARPTHFSSSSIGPLRSYSKGESEFDPSREVDTINLKFAEAREEIETAMESKETVYFNEEAECARAAVEEALGLFESLSAKLPEDDRAALRRSMGLKMEQLKAELKQLDE